MPLTPERRRQVEALCHGALEQRTTQRSAWLVAACAGDEDLLREVESLLAQQASADRLDRGIQVASVIAGHDVTMAPGRRIGLYEIVMPIAAGGMGEVYKARDTRLGREVAIKVLPRTFTTDPDRLARIEREARVLASLNHPNIATIHGVEESDGVKALVLELVPGDTLAERIARTKRGGLPLTEALAIAKQIADALDAAHEKGIIHRDLKPANIKVTPDGLVKVLDFGLAKLRPGSSSDASDAATETSGGTRQGLIVGTAAYMSPQQARGQTVDKRTDIWAFGCVLYEMLTGWPPFRGATSTDILVAVVERPPDWSLLPPGTPASVRRGLRRCLEKDTKRRARDIGDVAAELDEESPSEPSQAQPRWRSIVGWTAFIVMGAAGGAFLWLSGHDATDGGARPVQFALTIPQQANDLLSGTIPTPSPDGRSFAFLASNGSQPVVWIRALDAIEARPLPGTEGASGTVVWSPDGRWIAFFAGDALKKIAPSGGPAQTIAAIPGFQDAAWSTAGEIVFRVTNRAGLVSVSEKGGTPRTVTTREEARGENSHRFPQFLPDGRRFIFTTRSADRSNNALYVASIDSPEVTRVMPAQSRVIYIPGASDRSGHLLFYKDGALMGQRFDLEEMRLDGEAEPLFDKISYAAASILAGFHASGDGRTVIVEASDATDDALTWFNRDGTSGGIIGPPGDYAQLRLSPTGDRVAYTKPDNRSGNRDIWYVDIARGIAAPVTNHGANDWYPVWSADGRQLLFDSDRENGTELLFLKKSIDVNGDEERLALGRSAPMDWTRDGRWVSLYGDGDLWVQRMGMDDKAFKFLGTSFREFGGRFSPDGRWITYVSDESGSLEVYVRPFSGAPASADGKIQISMGGGDFPVWRADGQELFFMAADFSVYASDVRNLWRSGSVPSPRRLFKACPNTAPNVPPLTSQTWGYPIDTRDGQTFLVNCRVRPAGRYVVLLNALTSLR